MNQLELSEIIDKVVNKSDLTTKDIPSLDLYMDQIMTLFDDHLQDNKRFVDDKLLTKTMINNYSKAGVIKPVKGKKYTKEQIIGMLLIYDQFIEIKKFQSDQLKPLVLKTVENFNLDIDNDNQRLISIMALSSLSNQLTNIVQGIIDNYYIESE